MGSRIAIIPARGGSTRLPRKNILPVGGKPLIAWTIKAALDSGVFDHVLVSTDDVEIGAVAREWNAEVPFLREGYADQHSPSSLATIASLAQAEAFWGCQFDVVAQLLPTCPLRGAEHIREAMRMFEENGASSQISVFKFGWMNPWWAISRRGDGTAQWLFPEARTQRSQDLNTLYCPSGAIWIARSGSLRAAKSFYTDDHVIAPLPWQAAIDIDNYDDLEMAEVLLSIAEAKREG